MSPQGADDTVLIASEGARPLDRITVPMHADANRFQTFRMSGSVARWLYGTIDPARVANEQAGRRSLPDTHAALEWIVGLLFVAPYVAISVLQITPLLYEPLCSERPDPGCFPWYPDTVGITGWAQESRWHYLAYYGAALATFVGTVVSIHAASRRGPERWSWRPAIAFALVWIALAL